MSNMSINDEKVAQFLHKGTRGADDDDDAFGAYLQNQRTQTRGAFDEDEHFSRTVRQVQRGVAESDNRARAVTSGLREDDTHRNLAGVNVVTRQLSGRPLPAGIQERIPATRTTTAGASDDGVMTLQEYRRMMQGAQETEQRKQTSGASDDGVMTLEEYRRMTQGAQTSSQRKQVSGAQESRRATNGGESKKLYVTPNGVMTIDEYNESLRKSTSGASEKRSTTAGSLPCRYKAAAEHEVLAGVETLPDGSLLMKSTNHVLVAGSERLEGFKRHLTNGCGGVCSNCRQTQIA